MTQEEYQASNRHRELNYKIYTKAEELKRLAQETTCDVGGDPGLEAAIDHVLRLLVTANHRQLIRAYPEAIRAKFWGDGQHHYLTRAELESMKARVCKNCGRRHQVILEFCPGCNVRIPTPEDLKESPSPR